MIFCGTRSSYQHKKKQMSRRIIENRICSNCTELVRHRWKDRLLHAKATPRRLPFDLSIRMFVNVPAGLPLVFYEEVCKSFEEQHASFTVPRYGHILEAVANCVHTLLRENTELQDEQRSILDEGRPQGLSLNFADESVASSLSLGQLALLSSGRWSQDGQMNDAPELHREVFVMHSELAHSREEVRQLSKQKELERDMQEAKLRKAKGEMSQMQLEMDEMQEMQQAHLEEVYVFQEELQKLRSRTPSRL